MCKKVREYVCVRKRERVCVRKRERERERAHRASLQDWVSEWASDTEKDYP
jgi:hypothetical protein